MNSLTIILPSPLPADQNAAIVYIQSLGGAHSSGGRTQLQALKVVSQILETDLYEIDWSALRYQHTAMIRAQVASAYAPATANKILVALRQTLKRAWLLGQMSAEDYQRAIQLDPITGEMEPAGRYLAPEEIESLILVCKQDENYRAGTRDAAIIALLHIFRREEVSKLSLSSYEPATGRLTVIGKRRKQRTVYVDNGAKAALDDWLSIRGIDPGALFVAIRKNMKLDPRRKHITPGAINNIVAERSRQAGVENNSPHNFRRTAISNLLDSGETDITTIAKLFGHKNVQTTSRYDRRPDTAKKKAASLLHIPY